MFVFQVTFVYPAYWSLRVCCGWGLARVSSSLSLYRLLRVSRRSQVRTCISAPALWCFCDWSWMYTQHVLITGWTSQDLLWYTIYPCSMMAWWCTRTHEGSGTHQNKINSINWKLNHESNKETGDMLYLTKNNINSLKRSVAIIFFIYKIYEKTTISILFAS